MKLIHNENENPILNHLDDYSFSLSEMRSVEEKFYIIFDLNPCPMSIHDIKTGTIIDVNQSFIDVLGFKCKNDIIGKSISDKEYNLLNVRDKKCFMNKLVKNGIVNEMPISFRNLLNKKIKGLFSGTFIELNDKQCILIICQVITKKSVLNYLLL